MYSRKCLSTRASSAHHLVGQLSSASPESGIKFRAEQQRPLQGAFHNSFRGETTQQLHTLPWLNQLTYYYPSDRADNTDNVEIKDFLSIKPLFAKFGKFQNSSISMFLTD